MLASSAQSSGCCDETPRWSLTSTSFTGYDNSIVARPANDSRVNLALLLADRHGGAMAIAPPATSDASGSQTPSPFFQWRDLAWGSAALEAPDPVCANRAAAAKAFVAALATEARIPDGEKRALTTARQAMETGCVSRDAAQAVDLSRIGTSEFATYLRGAMDFYAGSFDAAGSAFAGLGGARNGWLKEAALYMVARSALNRAQATAFDEYGSLADAAKRDRSAIDAAGAAFGTYLKAYPAGRYAVSARGLMRRVYWLGGDSKRLGEEYAKLFTIDPARRGIDDLSLSAEIDNKLPLGVANQSLGDPVLLAVADLMRMRAPDPLYGNQSGDKPITRAEIDAQAGSFASDKPLFDYVKASHSFYVAKRPAEVLALIPDAARQKRFSSLQFSRQMLRGFALDATKDVNARGFWLELIDGAAQGYQRQTVELALALHEERNGGLARVFAAGSKITDPRIRSILLGYAAGPAILRQQASSASAPPKEREFALFVLLTKSLGRGLYADFVRDVRLVPSVASARDGSMTAADVRGMPYGDPAPPLKLFVAAQGYGDFGCPPLRDTAAQLAANPRASKALICVAEFFRTANFDHFVLDAALPKTELGGAPSLFPAKPFSRLETYKAVIADPAAPANDKAYALYRAVRCYAPSGNNDCGGIEVDKAQRRAWFLRLKRDYPQSSWAKSSDLYW